MDIKSLFEEMVAKGLVEVAKVNLSVALASSVIYRVGMDAFYGRPIERLETGDFQERRN